MQMGLGIKYGLPWGDRYWSGYFKNRIEAEQRQADLEEAQIRLAQEQAREAELKNREMLLGLGGSSRGSGGGSGGGSEGWSGLGASWAGTPDKFLRTQLQSDAAVAELQPGRDALDETLNNQRRLAGGLSDSQMKQMAGAASDQVARAGRASAERLMSGAMPGGADPFAAAAIQQRAGAEAGRARADAMAGLQQQNYLNQLNASQAMSQTAGRIGILGQTAAHYRGDVYDPAIHQQTQDAFDAQQRLEWQDIKETRQQEEDEFDYRRDLAKRREKEYMKTISKDIKNLYAKG